MNRWGSPAVAIVMEGGMDIVVAVTASTVNFDMSPFLCERP